MKSILNVKLLVFGLLAYVVILVLTFPAQRGYAYWQDSAAAVPNISLAGISGSVWSGAADAALIHGQQLKSLHWQFQPWALLYGQVGLSWQLRLAVDQAGGSDDGGYSEGNVRLGLDSSVRFPVLEGRIPAAVLASLGGLEAVRPSGTVSFNLQDLHWDGRSLLSATGRIVWNGAGVNLLKPVTLGGLVLTLETSEGEIKGLLSDASGPLAANGVLHLKADGSYQFEGEFSARQGVAGAADLAKILASLGRPAADGKLHLSQSGQLPNLGLTPASQP